MKINRFEEHNTLHVFDFDDTLVESPRFEKLALKYLKEDLTVKDLLYISIKKSGCDIKDIKYDNGRLYVDDPTKKFKEIGNWKRKNNRLYLLSPEKFGQIDESLPTKLKLEMVNLYNSVENKCIITARSEVIRDKITKTLLDLGISYPKFGLHMRPKRRKNAGMWKGEMIVKLVKKYNFTKVIFYDDNSKYIRKANRVVRTKLPDLDFKTVKVL